jgi:DNA-binding NarL/FixJ family response regulator
MPWYWRYQSAIDPGEAVRSDESRTGSSFSRLRCLRATQTKVDPRMNQMTPRCPAILVVHDDPLVRAGLVAALRRHGPFEVFDDHDEPDRRDRPAIDVIVADYRNALRLIEDARSEARPAHDAPRILALTTNDREADIRRALQAGVHGYLLLGAPLEELIDGVVSVARGVRYLCRSVAQRLADSLSRATLTARELDVLRLVMAGESNKLIARQLGIELGTVKTHVSAIMAKLGAATRTQAARIGVSRGLIEDDEMAPSARRPSFIRPTPSSNRSGRQHVLSSVL